MPKLALLLFAILFISVCSWAYVRLGDSTPDTPASSLRENGRGGIPTPSPRATLSQTDTSNLIDDVLYQAALDAVLVDMPKEIDEVLDAQESDYSFDVGEAVFLCESIDGWISRNNIAYKVILEHPQDSDRRTLGLERSNRYREQLENLDRECASFGW